MKLKNTMIIGCLGMLMAPSLFAMQFEVKSIGPDPLKLNGVHKDFKGELIKQKRDSSFKDDSYVYQSLSKINHDGKEYTVLLVGLTDKGSPISQDILRVYDHDNKLVESALLTHTGDHPHMGTLSETGPKNKK